VDFVDANSLSDAVYQKVQSIGVLLDEHEAALPHKSCEEFIKGIRIVLSAVAEYHHEWVQHVSISYTDESSIGAMLIRQTSSDCLRIVGNIEEELLSLLDASLRQPTFLIQPTLERAIAAIGTSPSFELTLVPGSAYRYGFFGKSGFVTTELEKFSKFASKEAKLNEASDLPQWTFFLMYPVVERDSALNQVVLAHELAHLINELHDVVARILPAELDAASFSSLVREVGKSPGAQAMTPDEVESYCYQRCLAMLTAWVTEIVADVIAIHAVGPAYFFSFLEFFGNAAMPDKHDNEHPAPSYRGVILVEELKHLGYMRGSGVLFQQLSYIRPKLESSVQDAIEKYDSTAMVAHNTIEASRSNILRGLRDFCRTFSYFSRMYRKQVPPLVTQLRRGLLPMDPYSPGRRPEALSPAAILNAGWQVYRTESKNFYSLFIPTLEDAEKLVHLNQLIFKSLETNEVLREYFQ
jgi:hypothetical protein